MILVPWFGCHFSVPNFWISSDLLVTDPLGQRRLFLLNLARIESRNRESLSWERFFKQKQDSCESMTLVVIGWLTRHPKSISPKPTFPVKKHRFFNHWTLVFLDIFRGRLQEQTASTLDKQPKFQVSPKRITIGGVLNPYDLFSLEAQLKFMFFLLDPPKINMSGWNIDHEWRCISYWTWGFSNVILVFRGVDPWDFARNSGCQEASVALGLFWIGEYHKLQSSWWRGRGVLEVRGEFVGFFYQKNSVVFFQSWGSFKWNVMLQKKNEVMHSFCRLNDLRRKSPGFPRFTSFNLFFGEKISDWTKYHLSIGVALPAALVEWSMCFLLVKMLPPKKYRPSSEIFFPPSSPY